MFSAGFNFLSTKTFSLEENLRLEKKSSGSCKSYPFPLLQTSSHCSSDVIWQPEFWGLYCECPLVHLLMNAAVLQRICECKKCDCKHFSQWWPKHSSSINPIFFFSKIDHTENWSFSLEELRFPKLAKNPLNCSSTSADHSFLAIYIEKWNMLLYP